MIKFELSFFILYLELFGGYQLTLRSFEGVPVRKFETFYLPKKIVIFRGVPVKKNTLYNLLGRHCIVFREKPIQAQIVNVIGIIIMLQAHIIYFLARINYVI